MGLLHILWNVEKSDGMTAITIVNTFGIIDATLPLEIVVLLSIILGMSIGVWAYAMFVMEIKPRNEELLKIPPKEGRKQ